MVRTNHNIVLIYVAAVILLRSVILFVALLIIASTLSCGDNHKDKEPASPEPGIEIRPEALWKTGPVEWDHNGNPIAWVLPIGQRITPLPIEGSRLFLFEYAMPLGMQIHPDGRHLFITNSGGGSVALLVMDVETGEILSSIRKSGYFLGLAFSPDGSEVYVSGGGREVIETYVFEPETGALSAVEYRTMHTPGFSGGICTTGDGSLLLAVAQVPDIVVKPGQLPEITIQMPGTLCIFDPRTGALLGQTSTGLNPYAVAVHPNGTEAYVSNEMSNSVTVFDISNPSAPRVTATVMVQKNPEALSVNMEGTRLYVANADEDSVSSIQIETADPMVISTFDLRPSGSEEYGSSPNAMAFSGTGSRLYVAQAGKNTLSVIDPDTGLHIGDIPTAWYPTAVSIHAQLLDNSALRETLFVANGKGVGTPWEGDMGYVPGAISVIPVPDDPTLGRVTTMAAENNGLPGNLFDIHGEYQNPVPVRNGDTTPIKHVFLVIRENKTYDYILGSYVPPHGEADGDPRFTFGNHDKVLPNLYRLAERFAIGDNYYCNAESSDQGHEMLTASMVNTFMEKLVFARDRVIPMKLEMVFSPAAWPKKDHIFQNALRNNLTFRDYGEAVGTGKDGLMFNEQYVHHGKYDPPWFWPISWDVDKMSERIKEWESPRFSGENLPRLILMLLPNDHSFGRLFPLPTPESMIADNDEATGIFVEWLSHSPYWKESVAFITEDDPQQGNDHVDPHRTMILVVSPWVREGYVSHVRYSEANLYATIEHILGLPPMTIFDEVAQPMYDLFTFEGNDQPFDHTPRMWPKDINPPGTKGDEQSAVMNFSEPDHAEGLPEVLQDMEQEKEHMREVGTLLQRGVTRALHMLVQSITDKTPNSKGGSLGPAGVVREMVQRARSGDLDGFKAYLDGSLAGTIEVFHLRGELLNATVLPLDPVEALLSVFSIKEPLPVQEEIQGREAIVNVQYKDGVSARLHFIREDDGWKFRLTRHLAPSARIMDDSLLLLNTFQKGRSIVELSDSTRKMQ